MTSMLETNSHLQGCIGGYIRLERNDWGTAGKVCKLCWVRSASYSKGTAPRFLDTEAYSWKAHTQSAHYGQGVGSTAGENRQ